MIKTRPLSVSNIKEITKVIRKEYNINPLDPFPIYDILDKLHENNELSIQVLDNDDPYLENDVKALYNGLDNFIYIKEDTLLDLENKRYRSNFTLAHEFFHYIEIHLYEFEYEEVEECKPYEDPEWQANEFAGELLLPIEALENKDDEYLSEYYKVSIECVLTRRLYKDRREKRLLEK